MSALIPEAVDMEMRRKLPCALPMELRDYCASMWTLLVRLDAKVADQEAKIKELEARHNNTNWTLPNG